MFNSFSSKQLEKRRAISTVSAIVTFLAPAANAGVTMSAVLGQYGISVNEFCSEFNELTSAILTDTPIPVTLFVSLDRRFAIDIHVPHASFLIYNRFGFDDTISPQFPVYLDDDSLLSGAFDVALFQSYFSDNLIHYKDVRTDSLLPELVIQVLDQFRSMGYLVKLKL